MPAKAWDLVWKQGKSFTLIVEVTEDDGVTPKDITGYTARMQVRQTSASTTVLADLTMGSGLAVSGPSGLVTLTRTAAQTAAYTWDRASYDLELVDLAGKVYELLAGYVHVPREVTR